MLVALMIRLTDKMGIFPAVNIINKQRNRKVQTVLERTVPTYLRERIASESLQKIRTKFYEVAGPVGRVKTVVTNHFRKMFRSRIHKEAEFNTTARIN